MLSAAKKLDILKIIYSYFPSEVRFGYRTYKEYRKLISRTEYYSKDDLKAFQLKQFKKIVNHAWNNTEGYRELWSDHGFDPTQLNELSDINKIPFITKEIIRDNLEKFSYKKLRNIQKITTGGSTGIPFEFYLQRKNNLIELAFIHDIWSRFYEDIEFSTKATILRGKKLDKPIGYDPLNGLILSSFDLTPTNINSYVKNMESYKSAILRAYPSSLYVLTSIMDNLNLKITHNYKAIMLGSEKFYDFQKEQVEKIFNAPIVNWYGHGEKAVLAGYCEHSTDLHVFPQYGITEIIDKNNIEVSENETGEIVGTSFWNYATPFIRYKTMDYAKKGEQQCKKCHRNYDTITEIIGREHEFIVDKKKKLIALTGVSIICGTFKEILQFRFYQDKIGKITFNYVKKPEVNEVNFNFIKNSLFDKIGGDFEIDFKEVHSIERTNSGKFMYLDQKLNIKNILRGKE